MYKFQEETYHENKEEKSNENEEKKKDEKMKQKHEFIPLQKKTKYLQSNVEEIVFCDEDGNNILMLTKDKKIFQTKTFGQKWSSIKKKMDNLHYKNDIQIVELIQNPNDNNTIIFVDKNQDNMITRDCGSTFEQLKDETRIKDILFHPTNKKTILVLDKDNNLLLSENEGKDWNQIFQNVKEFIFAKYSDNAYFANKNRIFIINEIVNKQNAVQKNLLYSDDFFKHHILLQENVEFFKITKCCIYVQEKDGEMKIADAFGWFYHFYNLRIENMDDKTFKEFNIIDNDVLYNTYGTLSYKYKEFELNKLMKSDYYGSHFKILQEDLVCLKQMNFCDFIPIRSLNGVIIINKYDKSYIEASIDLPQSRRKNYNDVHTFEDIDDFKQTFISFNYGETFQRIKAPLYTNEGNPVGCLTDCYLNIHLQSSVRGFTMPQSSTMIPGFLIASGSISKYLVEEEHSSELYLGVFISWDGGLNWKMIASGRHTFEIINKGSVILLAAKNRSADHILYSINGGQSFEKLKISKEPVEVNTITVKDNVHFKKFIIYAKTPSSYQKKSQVITVDFSNLHERDCEHDKENKEQSDYEEWMPHSTDDNGCFEGRKIIMTRKKPERECFNEDNYSMYYVKDHCKCTENDYHCDFGYSKDQYDQCRLNSDINMFDFHKDPPHCKDHYFRTDGYRKNFETFCQQGVQHPQQKVYCHSQGFLHFLSLPHFSLPSFNIFGHFWGKLFKFGILLGLIYLIYYGIQQGYHHVILDKVEQFIPFMKRLLEKRKEKTTSNYSQLQQKQFVLEKNNNKNLGSIFELQEEDNTQELGQYKETDILEM